MSSLLVKWNIMLLYGSMLISVLIQFDVVANNKITNKLVVVNDTRMDTVSLIADPFFEQGLVLVRASEPSPGKLNPFKTNNVQAFWKIAEWGTNYFLSDQNRTEMNNIVCYRNEGKYLKLQKLDTIMGVTMGVIASNEYDHPRVLNQDWPHLLLEQEFISKKLLKDLTSLSLKFRGKLNISNKIMNDKDYNPSLHAAQFQLFLTVQNGNSDSVHFGDYFWFGVPFYDSRNRIIEEYAAQDAAKEDATGKFIYIVGSKDFMQGTFHDKKWMNIDVDLYPSIIKGLELAKSRGYLVGSDFEDLQISAINMGWEVPGTFDVEFEFEKFDLQAVVCR